MIDGSSGQFAATFNACLPARASSPFVRRERSRPEFSHKSRYQLRMLERLI
jgi:hypothetical protein